MQADGFGNCFSNSLMVAAPNLPATSLDGLELVAEALTAGEALQLCFIDLNTNSAFEIVVTDEVDIGQVWNEVEFNVVGDAGGSRANFNPGSAISAEIWVADGEGFGNSLLPTCRANAGSTGETNNLNLGACTVSPFPHKQMISFSESN